MAIEDNASLALIPSGYKSGKLYSVIPDSGNGDFTHTRGSTATRVNAGGLIETMANDVPRLDYPLIDGVVQSCPALLLEPSRTNKLPYSLDYDNNTYYQKSNSTVTSESGISPDGANTAYKLQDTNDLTATSHYIQQASGYRAVIDYDAIKTASVFVKAGTKKQVQIRLANGAGSFSYIMGNFDLETETILTGASSNASNISYDLQNYGNGWYRCIVSGSWNLSNVTQSIVQVFIADSSLASLPNIHNYQGDGTGTLFVWGQMIEEGSYPTSYIPSLTGSETTRSADICNNAGTSLEFNDTESSWFVELQGLAEDNTNKYITISDGGGSPYTNSLAIQYRNNGTLRIFHNGLDFADAIFIGGSSFDLTENHKIAIRFKQNDMAVYIDGVSQSLNGSFVYQSISGLNTLRFEQPNAGNAFFGKVKQLMVFKTALSDSDLATLTSL